MLHHTSVAPSARHHNATCAHLGINALDEAAALVDRMETQAEEAWCAAKEALRVRRHYRRLGDRYVVSALQEQYRQSSLAARQWNAKQIRARLQGDAEGAVHDLRLARRLREQARDLLHQVTYYVPNRADELQCELDGIEIEINRIECAVMGDYQFCQVDVLRSRSIEILGEIEVEAERNEEREAA